MIIATKDQRAILHFSQNKPIFFLYLLGIGIIRSFIIHISNERFTEPKVEKLIHRRSRVIIKGQFHFPMCWLIRLVRNWTCHILTLFFRLFVTLQGQKICCLYNSKTTYYCWKQNSLFLLFPSSHWTHHIKVGRQTNDKLTEKGTNYSLE